MDEIINWLLEGPSWLRYAVELQLLHKKPDAMPAIKDSAISALIYRLRDKYTGIPALKSGRANIEKPGNAYWDLFFLADIGLTIDDLKLNQAIEEILHMQRRDGTFVTEPIMNPDYFCMSALLLSSVAKMGYRDDQRVKKYLEVVLKSGQPAIGWHCENCYSMGHTISNSCPMDNVSILLFLSNYEKYIEDSRVTGAIDTLLNHWGKRKERLILDGYGIGKRFISLQYPSVQYRILRVLDALSFFPHARKNENFQNMLDSVRAKSMDGKYQAESITNVYPEFDFDQTREPSRWVTFLIKRVEYRSRL